MMMLAYISKRHSQTLIIKHLYSRNLCSTPPKQIIPTNHDSSDFKISFLQDKCGLSGKSLIKASKYVDFDSSDQRPHSVLELFRSFGFTQPNIARIVSFYPGLLYKYHPEKIIKPKLDFLLSISECQAEVVAVVTKNPSVLIRSLNNHLIPSLDILNSFTGSYTDAVSVLKCNPYILTPDLSKSLMLNAQFLRTLGVPHSWILKLLRSYGPVLGIPHNKFRNFVSKLMDMGFDLQSSYFHRALYSLTFVNYSTWESRWVLFRSLGFSENESLSIFKKLPALMYYKKKTIIEKTEFFLNKLRWTPFRLSSNPAVLAYSLEKRIIPRCSVLQVLVSENSSSESYGLSTILSMTEKKFIERFITADKDEVPGIMEAYQGRLRFDEYTFKQKAHKDDIILHHQDISDVAV